MFDLDGSDFSWLVYADYLQDQGIDVTYIREGVENPQTNDWFKLDPICDEVGGSGFEVRNRVGGGGFDIPQNAVGGGTSGIHVGAGGGRVGSGSTFEGVGCETFTGFRRISIPLVRRIYPSLMCLILVSLIFFADYL